MPRTDFVLRLLALAALSAAPGLALALCQPLAAGDKLTVVADVRLDDTNTLLGKDGSRVRSWLPPVQVPDGPRATPILWAERVDWSVYAAEPGARIGVTVLRFERGVDGRQHLCGIAQYNPHTVDEARAQPGPALPPPDNETRFRYDAAGRLTGYDLRSRAWDGRQNRPVRHCLRYDANGWLAELTDGACDGATRPQVRYVHDAAGRLLRTIRHAPETGEANEVIVHDAKGGAAQRYLRPVRDTEDGLGAQAALPYRAVQGEHPILVLPSPNWQPPALDSYHYDWAIVQPRGDADVYDAKRDPSSVLASGNSGANGRFDLSADARQRIWKAAGSAPGGVQWLWAPGQVLTLLQAMPGAAWAACADTQDRSPAACPAP